MTDIFSELAAAIADGDSATKAETVVSNSDAFPLIPEGFGTGNMPAPRLVEPISADRGDKLNTLVDTALLKAQELLEIPLDPLSDEFTKIASMQKDLVVSLVNTGVKIDENRFKKRTGDALTGILASLIDREAKLKPLIDLSTARPN